MPEPFSLHRVAALAALLAVAACAPPPPTPLTESPPDAALAGPKALFSEEPEALFAAFAEACSAPGQSLLRPTPDRLQCESLPPVEAAAGLILEFGGSVEDLPRVVTVIDSERTEAGIVVSSDTFIRVPQQGGGFRVLRPDDPGLDRTIRRILTRAGGTPL